ncbi:MAG: inositol monophosphatase [Blautia sp.]|nr:inositol monophosphatase [Blautia sp.]
MSDQLLEQIMDAAREAGGIMLSARDGQKSVKSKEGHANFVTEYDEKIQRFLIDRLSAILPEAAFVGEEEGKGNFEEAFRNGFTFIIDPIDGTSNFMKGYRPSVTSIGLLKDDKPYLGVIYNPYYDEMIYAKKGEGAFCNGEKLSTSEDTLADSLVLMGTCPYYEPEVSHAAFELGFYYQQRSIDVRRSGTCAYDLCSVAAGRTGLYFEPRVYVWDYAAGACIVQEAGGRVTDLQGRELNFRGKSSILAVSKGVAGESYLPPDSLQL